VNEMSVYKDMISAYALGHAHLRDNDKSAAWNAFQKIGFPMEGYIADINESLRVIRNSGRYIKALQDACKFSGLGTKPLEEYSESASNIDDLVGRASGRLRTSMDFLRRISDATSQFPKEVGGEDKGLYDLVLYDDRVVSSPKGLAEKLPESIDPLSDVEPLNVVLGSLQVVPIKRPPPRSERVISIIPVWDGY